MVEIPLRTGSGLNDRLHWRSMASRAKKERHAAWLILKGSGFGNWDVPCTVRMVRRSSGSLDSDNLQGALKSIRDGIADALGIKDNDPRVTWEYAQEKCKRGIFGVRVEIT